MIRTLFPPLVAVALASMLAMPLPTRAAEPALASTPVLTTPAAPAAVDIDPIAKILRVYVPTSIFVGRDHDGNGYVLASPKKAFVVLSGPNGVIRFRPAAPAKIKTLASALGWVI